MSSARSFLVISAIVSVAGFAGFAGGCRVDPETVPQLTAADVRFRVPQGFPAPVYNFAGNPVTLDGFILGRKLFYDPRLSRDNSTSCGSCHQQFVAFAHSTHQFSHGIDGLTGTRNAPGIFNLAWNQVFMWDGGINHIENQPIGPITNPIEMDETLPGVITKLSADPAYREDFKAAFGDDSINTQRICRALAQFMGIMISDDSKYDRYRRGEVSLSQPEMNGLAIFRTKCASCHTEPLLTDGSFHNNGLPVDPTIDDIGRMTITGDPADSLKFKTPSLRNIALTGPYMHDGRFITLAECLDHYSSGVVQSATLDPALAANNGIPLTPQEKSDLIAFLSTLTDYTFITDPRFKEAH